VRADRFGGADRPGADRPSRFGGTGERPGARDPLLKDDRPGGGRGTGPRRALDDDNAPAGGVAAFADGLRDPDEDAVEHDDDHDPLPPPNLKMFLRRLVIAMIWLALALGLGVGAGLIYEKVRPSGATSGSPTTAATVVAPAPVALPTASATPTSAVPTVPPDWVSATITSSNAASTFSHPSSWTERSDSTMVMFTNPAGAEMVAVARRTGVDGPAAISKVEAIEFNTQTGFSVTSSGNVKDPVSGATVFEVIGTYTRQGQQVAFMMHSVETPNAAYVLVVRAAVASDAELDTYMRALRASFKPS
jgi:hypothetical protein